MSENPPEQPSFWNLSNPWVRGGVAALIILLGATAYKEYQDSQRLDEDAERARVTQVLERHHAALSESLDAQQDQAAFLETLPLTSPWLPQELPCGVEAAARGSLHPAWQLLWAPQAQGQGAEDDAPMRYQIRFARSPRDGTLTWLARRDGDCDGLYEVHTLRVHSGVSGVLRRSRVEVQHLGE